MRRIVWHAIILMLCGSHAPAAEVTAGDLTLSLDASAQVTGLSVAGQALPTTRAPLVTLWASDTEQTAAPTVRGGGLDTGVSLRFEGARASAALTVTSVAGDAPALRFTCRVRGDEGPDRGLILRFAFPVDATGWRWHDDMQSSVAIEPGRAYENVQPLRAYADLPEWKDKPALRMGYSNRNFCSVISSPASALALAVPMDQPRLFRTAYDAVSARFEIVYDFALSGLTRQPYEAEFSFDLYSCDPAWGLRSALQRYYALYPEMFRVHVPDQGAWMAFNRLSEIDNANEFGFGLQEGAPEADYDDKIGVLSTNYYTHAGMPANLPAPYDPEKDPLPPYEEQVKAVNEAFRSATGLEGLYDAVGTRKPDGELAVEKWTVYAHLIAQFNLDPELPWGKWLVEATTRTNEWVRQKSNGGQLDGFYYDGLTHGLNYAREHFKTADSPLLWDPVNKQPFLHNFFSSIEFARATAEFLRPRGQITMMNGGMGESCYVVPWLDILGEETGLIIPRAGFNFVRASLHHKPFMTLLKGNYEQQIGRPEMELFMKRCLAYGVYPGFFDWPPSGLGPGGQYWNHPRYYERDRDLHRKYQPLCKALAMAGWEPVTHARSSEPTITVERFGPAGSERGAGAAGRDPAGVVWLTLLNESQRDYPTTLTVDAKALGLDPARVRVTEIAGGRSLTPRRRGDQLCLDVLVPPEGVLVVQLGSPPAVAAWHLAQAVETLDRGALQRKVDAGKPPLLVHWRPSGRAYDREQLAGKTSVVFRADGKSEMGMHQWVMLFQPSPMPLTLKARVSATNLVTGGDGARLRCTLAWVTPDYTHYEDRYFDLPEGTYDWRDLEFRIESEHALRSLELIPTITSKASGELKIASLALTDEAGEHVIDGGFSQWYEPFPAPLRDPVESRAAALRQGLSALQAKTSAIGEPGFRKELGALFATAGQIESAIVQARAQNGARRVLRDLDTVRAHLGYVTLAVYNMTSPAITGPATAAPGDAVSLRFAPPKSAIGLPPAKAELQSSLEVTAQPGGGLVAIPATAKLGDVVTVSGLLHLGKRGETATLTATHSIRVVPPLELSLSSQGFDATTGAARAGVRVRNNRARPASAQVTLTAPSGWKTGGARRIAIPAAAEVSVDVPITPTGAPTAGPVEIAARAVAGKDIAQQRLVMLYIPPQANLIPNPGFEDALNSWSVVVPESVSVDTQVFRGGKQSLRLDNPTRRETQVSTSIALNQTAPTPILVQASSKAENVEGGADKSYSLYVDIYYTDGTPWYGNTFDFRTDTSDWQLGELYLEPGKPIRNVNVYLLLRNKPGRAWFDDVAVMEDPSRKGNLARLARVTVDSSYVDYEAGPINDGVIIGEGLHWTKEAWASGESDQDHFIEFSFAQPVTLTRALIYWSLDGGFARSSREVQLQVWENGTWRALQVVKNVQAIPQTEIVLDQPVMVERFRLLQPAGQGPTSRERLMWVREAELF